MPPETIDSLDRDALQAQVARLLARLDEVVGQNGQLLARIDTLLARIAELERRLDLPPKTPTNSSLPPSTGQKANSSANSPETPPKKKGRKGRKGVARPLASDPDKTRDIYAERCGCGAALAEADQPDFYAYDHIELPVVKPITTRINLHRGQCPCCKRRVAAKPPADMPPGSPFGPRIVETVTYLHACQMVSYERLTEVMAGLFGLKISEGAIANMLARAAKPLAASAEAIAAIVRASPVIASDETSARVCGKTHWQWTFLAATAVFHIIAPTRGKAVPIEFLAGARPQVWISDRLAAQCRHAVAQQFCLAHLIRDAQYAIDAGDSIFAPAFKRFLQRACAIGRRRPKLTDATIKAYAGRLARELDRLLELAPTEANGRHLQAAMIVDGRDKLLVFMTRRDVEPTNNGSERQLRSSVIFRKVTNCFRSAWGAKVYADIRSAVGTAKLNGRTALAGIAAALTGRPLLDSG